MSDTQPEERVMYVFRARGLDGADEVQYLGWWTGRRWVAVFGDGMWSPEYVTYWAEVTVTQ